MNEGATEEWNDPQGGCEKPFQGRVTFSWGSISGPPLIGRRFRYPKL